MIMIIQVSYMSTNRSLIRKYNIHVYGSVSLHSIITSVIHRKIGSSTLLWQRYPLSVTVLDLEQPFLLSFNLMQTLWRIVGNKYFTLVSFFYSRFSVYFEIWSDFRTKGIKRYFNIRKYAN